MIKILLPVDGAPESLDAVRHVMQLVHHGLRAEVVLAHVEAEPSLLEIAQAPDPDILRQVTEGAANDLMAPAESLLKGLQITYQKVIGIGDPRRVLLELCEAHHCHMIVMGTTHTSDLGSLIAGSVSHAIVNQARVPVTLVHRYRAESV